MSRQWGDATHQDVQAKANADWVPEVQKTSTEQLVQRRAASDVTGAALMNHLERGGAPVQLKADPAVQLRAEEEGAEGEQEQQEEQQQEDQGGNVLSVSMTVTGNLTNAAGDVIGMTGTQTITYQHSDGRTITETHNVNWEEDGTVENASRPYEHPAQPEAFDIVAGSASQTYPIQTTHSEGGIAIHAPGRSEGCILANQAIRTDLQSRLDNGVAISGSITAVTDSRTAEEQEAAPMP